ncbi:unnamed protein product [Hymenolepis diminuta]|uniref:Uncharacterized protein n=1 Tax=Hymenolepis diminuta TaxID=6216 RepID=A0A564YJZ6_HYMDI|nr:unnamed protein product [Hymenolepis diminuta]
MCSQVSAPWSPIDINLAKLVQVFSYLINVNLYSTWLEVIPIKFLANCTVITNRYATHSTPEVIVSRNIIPSQWIISKIFVIIQISYLYPLRLISLDWTSNLLTI